MPDLQISPEKIAWLILKLEAYEAKVAPYDSDAENDDAGEDQMADALENRNEDPVASEIGDFIASLNEDEETDLIALMWVGRGTFTVDDWDEARRTVRQERTTTTARYVMGSPLAADELAEGLVAFGIDPANVEADVSAEG